MLKSVLMKKKVHFFLPSLLLVFLFASCGLEDQAAIEEEVDMIGTWRYSIEFKPSPELTKSFPGVESKFENCSDLSGDLNFFESSSNPLELGYLTFKGDIFDFDSDGKCKVLAVSEDSRYENQSYVGEFTGVPRTFLFEDLRKIVMESGGEGWSSQVSGFNSSQISLLMTYAFLEDSALDSPGRGSTENVSIGLNLVLNRL